MEDYEFPGLAYVLLQLLGTKQDFLVSQNFLTFE